MVYIQLLDSMLFRYLECKKEVATVEGFSIVKRFTETTKWRDPWYRRLSPIAKLFWSYLTDNCNSIGLIEPDYEAAAFDIGSKIEDGHIKELESRIKVLSGGKIFIPKFIKFQYGELSESCPAHRPIISLVREHGLIRTDLGYEYPSDRVVSRVYDTLQERKGLEKDKNGKEIPTMKDVLFHAQRIGQSKTDAERFFHHFEAVGWMDGANRRIVNWQSRQSAWLAESRSKPPPKNESGNL